RTEPRTPRQLPHPSGCGRTWTPSPAAGRRRLPPVACEARSERPSLDRPPHPPLRVHRCSREDEAVVFYFKDPQVVRTPRPWTLSYLLFTDGRMASSGHRRRGSSRRGPDRFDVEEGPQRSAQGGGSPIGGDR